MGTQFNGRSEFIEFLNVGDRLQIIRDSDNFFDKFTLSVCNEKGQELGTMWINLADELSPLLDAGLASITDSHVKRVVPISKRETGAVKAILQMEMTIQLNQEVELQVSEPSEQVTHFTGQLRQSGIQLQMADTEISESINTASLPPVNRLVKIPDQTKSSKAWIAVLAAGMFLWTVSIGGGIYYTTTTYIPSQHYAKGYELYQQEKYILAIDELERAGDYKDAKQLLAQCYGNAD
jgi:hypothetical protein